MNDFVRFPHTPHLAWLGVGQPRQDKVLAPDAAQALLAKPILVEEKVDGANLGFSVGDDGALRAQNRGKYLELDALDGQWKPLRQWLSTWKRALIDTLGSDLILFGEWCFARHSVSYTRLPDWFLVFDVYDRQRQGFWCVDRRNELAASTGLHVVPQLGRGLFNLETLKLLLAQSKLTDAPAEGLYVRREHQGQLAQRAKLVRAEFVQAISEHWSRRKLEPNQLTSGPDLRWTAAGGP